MKTLKYLTFYGLISGLLIWLLAGCDMFCYMCSPPPLGTYVGGNWVWTKTMDKNGKVLDQSRAGYTGAATTISLHPNQFTIARQELNAALVWNYANQPNDSLFEYSRRDGSLVNHVDKKKKVLISEYVSRNEVRSVARFAFFYQKGKASPNKMHMSIQKNTREYNPALDTLIIEYIKEIL